MPSRRVLLAMLATVAGCTTESPGTPTSSTAQTVTTTGSTTETTKTMESSPSSVESPEGMTWGFAPPGSAGQVAVGDSLVFVADDAGNLYGVDPVDGTEVWSRSFEHPIGSHRTFERTLVTFGDFLYAFTGKTYLHGQEFEIHRLKPASGEVLWTQSPGIDNHHLYMVDATTDAILVGSQNDILGDWSDPALGVDAKTGHRRWASSAGDADSGVLADQHAYVGSYAGVTAIDRESGRSPGDATSPIRHRSISAPMTCSSGRKSTSSRTRWLSTLPTASPSGGSTTG